MRPEEQVINNMKFEVNKLQESPNFLKYVEIMNVIKEGKAIESIIQRKVQNINKRIMELRKIPEEDEEYSAVGDEYTDEIAAPPARKQLPRMRQEERPAVSQQRERELDRKVKAAASPERSYEAEAGELGLDEDIPGIPDNMDDLDDDIPKV